MVPDLDACLARVRAVPVARRSGVLTQVVGLTVEARGLKSPLGELCSVDLPDGDAREAEVVGFRGSTCLLMPLEEAEGLHAGARVHPLRRSLSVPCADELRGRVLDGLGRPLDGRPPPAAGRRVPLQRAAPGPLDRVPIDQPLETGLSVLDGFLTLGRGQRIGIFAGSGVGKSTLLADVARQTRADVNVIVLVGERGREVKGFIEDALGAEGLSRSVVVVATSDAPPLQRIKAPFTATAIAEHFREQGSDVMLMCDSVTRFAGATREVGLALGEPPTVKGYPPSFFSTVPRIVERLGRTPAGSITGVFTVLVDGDDMSDPVADTMRGLLDGHVVLARKVANRGHYPAVDVLQSTSRLMGRVASPEHVAAAAAVRDLVATYEDARDLVAVGAYKQGADPKVDRALGSINDIERFLCQRSGESRPFTETVEALRRLARGPDA